jgi:hypothetical protein
MIGGRAFVLLKAGPVRPESSEQPEIAAAVIFKILASEAVRPVQNRDIRCSAFLGRVWRIPLIWLIFQDFKELLSKSRATRRNWRRIGAFRFPSSFRKYIRLNIDLRLRHGADLCCSNTV